MQYIVYIYVYLCICAGYRGRHGYKPPTTTARMIMTRIQSIVQCNIYENQKHLPDLSQYRVKC